MEIVNILITPDGRVSRRDAALFLDLSQKTLGNWQTQGLGPRSFRVGGRRFYWLADLQAFVGAKEADAPPAEIGFSGGGLIASVRFASFGSTEDKLAA